MATMVVYQLEAHPGKASDVMALVGEAIPIATRAGATAPRIWQSTIAGPNTGRLIVAAEYPSAAAFAAVQDELSADPDWQALTLRGQGIMTAAVSILTEAQPA